MSILDTFYVLFKTDADKAAADIEKVDRASDKAERGLRHMDAAAGRLGSSFVAMGRSLVAPLVALASLGTVMSTVIKRIDEIDDIGDAAGKLRSSAADYEAFTRAVRASGGTLQEAQANLAGFSDKLNDAAARPDSINAKNFAKWGIVFKDVKGEAVGAVDGILALAKSLEHVSQAEAIGRLRRLGITDADTIAFLLQGKHAIEDKMRAEKAAGVVTDEQIRIVGEYKSAMGEAQNAIDTVSNGLTGFLVPALTASIRAFTRLIDWVSENSTLVKGFFIGVAAVVTATYLPAMTAAAAATVAALWPIIAIGAAVAAVGAAFALAYEDVVAFMNGQPSLIGALAARYEWFGHIIRGIGVLYENLKAGGVAAIDAIAQAWTWIVEGAEKTQAAMLSFWRTVEPVWTALKSLASAVSDLFGAISDKVSGKLTDAMVYLGEAFGPIGKAASDLFEGFVTDLEPVTSIVRDTADTIQSAFVGAFNAVKAAWDNTLGWIAGQISGLADRIRGLASSITGAGSAAPAGGGESGGSPYSAPPKPIPSGVLSFSQSAPVNNLTSTTAAGAGPKQVNNTANTNVGTVTVNTQATDAAGVAAALHGALKNEYRDAAAQFDDGVAK